MGITIIGGLIFSTLLTLLAVPVLYYVFIGHSDRRKARKAARRQKELERKAALLATYESGSAKHHVDKVDTDDIE